ncbi:hypothetical protein ATO7_14688 [Oceanococcus atlanticus]|uniref:UPF0102 protein ATO7_14688 n=1 Tax=Oceanococcus atlanticus TaxID=1317117 RepID=A0A1Y1SAM4_9GAMM|nr:YraN family protein [Oceanococcus atlanticus]ORE85478.1 hypothetical protein ATO7_14688 [Oceanococcus atlanticus]
MSARGAAAEAQACAYLEREGLICLERNMSCRLGEIDLIMRDREEVVIVEVRARAHGALVDALNSVSTHKRRRIIQATRYWQTRHPELADEPLRFDIVAINGQHIDWQRNAFEAL